MEFLRKRKVQTSDCINKIRQLRSSLEKLGQNPDELKAIEERVIDLDKNLNGVFEKKLSDLQIRILPLAGHDLEEFLHMAMENVPPFEESHEKGFRDSLIMFSILEALKGHPTLNALVVSDDSLFAQGILSRQAEYGVAITVVQDLGSAVACILTLVDEMLRECRRKEKEEAKELLLKYRSELERAVEKIREFSYFELLGYTPDLGNVERIVSFKFLDVASATWKTKTEESATILFGLNCILTVLAGPGGLGFLDTRYQVGGGIAMRSAGVTKFE